jgi:hypothetical protein
MAGCPTPQQVFHILLDNSGGNRGNGVEQTRSKFGNFRGGRAWNVEGRHEGAPRRYLG